MLRSNKSELKEGKRQTPRKQSLKFSQWRGVNPSDGSFVINLSPPKTLFSGNKPVRQMCANSQNFRSIQTLKKTISQASKFLPFGKKQFAKHKLVLIVWCLVAPSPFFLFLRPLCLHLCFSQRLCLLLSGSLPYYSGAYSEVGKPNDFLSAHKPTDWAPTVISQSSIKLSKVTDKDTSAVNMRMRVIALSGAMFAHVVLHLLGLEILLSRKSTSCKLNVRSFASNWKKKFSVRRMKLSIKEKITWQFICSNEVFF